MMAIDLLITQPKPTMIVKAIPKDGGLFIPGFSLPERASTDEVLVEVQVVPEQRKHAGTALAEELGAFLSQQSDPSSSSVVPMRREDPY